MPHQHEVTVVVTTQNELTPEQQEIVGRNAARGILQWSGSASSNYDNYAHRFVDAVEFRDHNYPTERYPGDDMRVWAVTEDERRNADEYEDDDDDF